MPTGCLDGQPVGINMGKIMTLKFETGRDVSVLQRSRRFQQLSCIQMYIKQEQSDINDNDMYQDGDLLFIRL